MDYFLAIKPHFTSRESPAVFEVCENPQVGGLHHRYTRRAA